MRRCGATSIKLVLDDPQEWLLTAESGTVMTEDGTSGYMVECPSATLIVSYSSGSTVFSRGTCRATYHYQQAEPLFDKHGRLLSSGYPQMTLLLSQLEYDFVEHTEMVNRSAIKTRTTVSPSKALNSTTADVGIDQTPDIPRPSDTDVAEDPRPAKRPKTEYTTSKDSTDVRQTTQPSQTALKRNESNSNWQECSIPGPPVRDTGLSDESMRVLEVSPLDTMCFFPFLQA